MNRCVIIGGAPIGDYAAAKHALKPGDFCIFCDGGLRHRAGLRVEPALVVGDFDSWTGPRPEGETIALPREKDDTDTVYAVKEALKRGFDRFLLLGAAGGRLDHTLGNLGALLMLHRQGKQALLVDDFSEMEMVGREPVYVEDSSPYFSLLNISGTARGITIENAKYPLENGEIPCDYQYGVSNQVLPGKRASVRVAEGELLLIRVRRDA